MNTANNIWGVVITVMVYALFYTFFYQVVFNYDGVQKSVFLAVVSTMFIRFVMGRTISELIDFKILRELITLLIVATITILWKN